MKKILYLALFGILICLNVSAKDEWNTFKGDHFIIYYKDADDAFLRKTLNYCEKYYNDIADKLGFRRFDFWLWDDRAKIYIYKNQQEYIQETGQPDWSAGVAIYRDKVIKTYPNSSGFFDILLPHELGHIIFREFVGFKSDVPLWLDEGVASYTQEAKHYDFNNLVRKTASEGKLIPLTELSSLDIRDIKDNDTVRLFYAEATSVIDFLVSQYGKDRFINFCRALKDGKTLDESLNKGYYDFKNLADLNDKWIKYLQL